MQQTKQNERSWAIELISEINDWHRDRDLIIKRAGGERTIKNERRSLFPDVLLYGDGNLGLILQGWELKMPDTDVDDTEFIANAAKKAKILGLNSFFLWNVRYAVLYIKDDKDFKIYKKWSDLSYITKREEVETYRPQISSFLHRILDELNRFLASGIIKPATIVDSVSGDGVTDLILSNTPIYAQQLRVYSNKNSDFTNEVTLWWYASRGEYGKSDDMWEVLARNNLLSILNKFIFAHTLKQYNQSADLVDTIDGSMSVVEGLDVFKTISSKADFWNIFNENIGERVIPKIPWDNFISLNLLLADLSIIDIEPTLVHDLLEKLSIRNKRKAAGQFATPTALARVLTRLVISDKELNAIDPCCGTGTIAKAIYDFKKEDGAIKPLDTTWASDKFALPLKMATLNLVEPENIGKLLRVFQADAIKIKPGEKITLHDPTTGAPIDKHLPEFDYILSNLPFVKSPDIQHFNKDALNINEFIVKKTGDSTLGLMNRGDLYTYLPFFLWNALSSRGYIGIIISNSWLGSSFGESFFTALKRFYDIESILTSGEGRWFENADVVANIVILRKRDDPKINPLQSIKFVTLNKSIGLLNADNEGGLIKALVNKNTDYSDDLVEIHTYSESYVDEFNTMELPLSAYFADLSWLSKLKDKTLPINTYFEVERGERRGQNEMFIPKAHELIEPQYLKPILASSKDLNGLLVKESELRKAFCCDETIETLQTLGHTGAYDWIKKFESKKNEKGRPLTEVLARAGTNWYTMKPDTLADLVTSLNPGSRLFFGKFDTPTFVDQRLIRLTVKNNRDDLDLQHALLNSLIGMFYLEALGFGRGDGALDLTATKLKKSMRILDISKISQIQRDAILETFGAIADRPVGASLEEEVGKEDRIQFEKTVLKAFELDDIYDDVQSSLLRLHSIRLSVN